MGDLVVEEEVEKKFLVSNFLRFIHRMNDVWIGYRSK